MFGVALGMIRVGIVALLFAFVEEFEVQAIPRVAVGIVAGVVLSVVVLILFANVLINTGLHTVIRDWALRCRPRWGRDRWGKRLGSETQGSSSPSNGSLSEKEKGSVKNGDEVLVGESTVNDNDVPPYPHEIDLGSSLKLSPSDAGDDVEAYQRPRNPTPLHNTPFKHPNHHIDNTVVNRSNRTSSYLMPPSASSSSFGLPPSSAFSFHSFRSFQSHEFRSASSHEDSGFSSAHSALHSVTSAPSALSSSGSTSTTFGSVLPRRPDFEGLGLEADPLPSITTCSSQPDSNLGSPRTPASPVSPLASATVSVAAASLGHDRLS